MIFLFSEWPMRAPDRLPISARPQNHKSFLFEIFPLSCRTLSSPHASLLRLLRASGPCFLGKMAGLLNKRFPLCLFPPPTIDVFPNGCHKGLLHFLIVPRNLFLLLFRLATDPTFSFQHFDQYGSFPLTDFRHVMGGCHF